MRRGIAEFVGTFTLIFIGGGAGIVSHGRHRRGVDSRERAFAIGIMVIEPRAHLRWPLQPGDHARLAVTRRISSRWPPLYWVFQLVGGFVAVLLLRYCLHRAAVDGRPRRSEPADLDGRRSPARADPTFFFVLAVWHGRRPTTVRLQGDRRPAAIGLTITIDVFVGGPVTGAAMNPARAFGPELAGNMWTGWWIYWSARSSERVIALGAIGYSYRPLQTEPRRVGTPESGVDEPRPGDTALS